MTISVSMAFLIACLSSGKGTWAQLYKMIEKESWEKVILITDEFGKEKFDRKPGTVLITLNFALPTVRMKELLIGALQPIMKDQIGFSEVAINISSGSGKEHMALISAMMALGVGFRLVDLENDSVVTL